MEATLEYLGERGVLGGFNMREVADAVGVTSANIYHHFGSRQGLLRSALTYQIDQLTDEIDVAVTGGYVEWRTAIFDLIQDHRPLRNTALLALDDDLAYEPLALWDLATEHYERLIDVHELDEDFDYLAAHALTLSMSMGMAIYGDAIARQMNIGREELLERARTMFVEMVKDLSAGTAEPRTPPPGSGEVPPS